MPKEVGRIYPTSNPSARKVITIHIHGVGRGLGGHSGGSGRGGGRGRGRGIGGSCVTHNIDIYKYVDGTETYVPQEVWIQ